MKIFLLGLIIFVGITSINSCEKDSVNNQQEQKIYFEFYAINYAWGLYYVHWVIDDQGNVRENKKQDSLIWVNSDNLNEYVEMFDTVIYTVEKSELDYYIDLIPSAANGEIFEKEHLTVTCRKMIRIRSLF